MINSQHNQQSEIHHPKSAIKPSGLFSILKLPSALVLLSATTSPNRWFRQKPGGQANSVAWEIGKPTLGYSRL